MARPREISTTGGVQILAPLSVGGMGEVHLARRKGALGFEKLVALKTIRPDLVAHPEMRRMFTDEARLLARLDHPAVAQVYDFIEQDSGLFLSMEYVAGIPLSKLMKRRQAPLPPEIVARIGMEVCRGLHAAHELSDLEGKALGVVHRDVSPQNLMLTFDGRMKILDFGVAFMFEREATTTQSGLFKGKLAYISPEQIKGDVSDRRSDVYSLSVVLHELLTAKRLFARSDTPLEEAIKRKKVASPRSINPEVPDALSKIVMKGLSLKPDKRYPDARALAAKLESFASEVGGESLEAFAERELTGERRTHDAWLAAAVDGNASTEADPKKKGEPTKMERPAALDSSAADLISYEPARAKRASAFFGIMIVIAALTAGAWLLFPDQFENVVADPLIAKVSDAIDVEILRTEEDDPELETYEEDVSEEGGAGESERGGEGPNPSGTSDEPPELQDGLAEPSAAPANGAGDPEEARGDSSEARAGAGGADQGDASGQPAGAGAGGVDTGAETPAQSTPPIPPKAIAKSAAAKPAPKRPPPRPKPKVRATRRTRRYGSLSVLARPGGTIWVNGRPIGKTPLKRRRIKPGKHTVALRRPGDKKPRWVSNVRVQEGKHVRIRLR